MKTENYNLIEEDWIPVLMKDGTNRRVSLGDLFAKGETIADLSLNPYERVAIMRLLICIAMAALDKNDLKDEASWRVALPKIKSAVAAYFDKWHDKFNFYGPNAFMQPDDLKVESDADKSSVQKLFPHLASGNNGTLYDHGRSIEENNMPIGMLVYQNYSAGGKHSKCIWGGIETAGTVSAGPAREKSMLHIYACGENLLVSIWLNLVTEEMIATLPNSAMGRPVWESAQLIRECLSQCGGNGGKPGLLQRLVPLSRVMKFSVGELSLPLGEGVKYDSLPMERECMGSVLLKANKDKIEPTYVSASEDEHPWRSLHAILSMKEKCGSLVLRHLNSLSEGKFSIWCGGLVANQAKDEATVEWRFSDDASLLNDAALQIYEKGILTAKSVSDKALYAAAAEYTTKMTIDKKDSVLVPCRARYWDILEKQQPKLLEVVEGKLSMEEWKKLVVDAAKKAFEETCPHKTGRQLEAYVQALNSIYLPSDDAAAKGKSKKGKKTK